MKNNIFQPFRGMKRTGGKKIYSAVLMGFLFFLFFSIIGSFFALFPGPVTIHRFITVFSFSIVIGIGIASNKYYPSWKAQFIGAFAITGLLLAWTIHCLSFGIIDGNMLIWLIPLASAFALAWILPFIFPSLAKVISDEQFNPKTKVGRGLLSIALSVGGVGGVLGALMGKYIYRNIGIQPLLLMMGIILAIITIASAQTSAYQIYASREQQNKVK